MTTTTSLDEEFEALTAALRPELLAHCYRLLGSSADAEDQVQETYLRAWKAFHQFEGRSSVRTWMYQIATNTCLSSMKKKRPLPAGVGQPSQGRDDISSHPEVPWLEPLADSVVWGAPVNDPAEQAVAHEGVGLAFVAALQNLPARQRAALVLRDVLQFSAAETADILGCSVAAANSALQRARASIDTGMRPEACAVDELSEDQRRLFADYVRAFERYDVDEVVRLLAEDAVWEMPPFPQWYVGAATIGELIHHQCPITGPASVRGVSTRFNRQPALALYLREADGVLRAFQVQVVGIVGDKVAHVASFFDTDTFVRAGLPLEWTGA